jgi:hypothetical protein
MYAVSQLASYLHVGRFRACTPSFGTSQAAYRRATGYRAKDRLDNALHGIVCRGAMRLRTAQPWIAANSRQLYGQVFGPPPPR